MISHRPIWKRMEMWCEFIWAGRKLSDHTVQTYLGYIEWNDIRRTMTMTFLCFSDFRNAYNTRRRTVWLRVVTVFWRDHPISWKFLPFAPWAHAAVVIECADKSTSIIEIKKIYWERYIFSSGVGQHTWYVEVIYDFTFYLPFGNVNRWTTVRFFLVPPPPVLRGLKDLE